MLDRSNAAKGIEEQKKLEEGVSMLFNETEDS